MVRVDTTELRAAAQRLRDEAAGGVLEAIENSLATQSSSQPLGFDQYGSFDGYVAVSRDWWAELGDFVEVLRQLADAMDKAAANYERSDQNADDRFGGGPR
ncbi:type VII secretion target [Plantactinospora sp. B5E13]|uniref:type VII secretion target n=1 Tax=unclassified Plantactinospora TaxID=2631981 RepID=UPI00325E15F3